MTIAVVNYNAGNIFSVLTALKRLGVEPILTDDAQALRRADRVIFPGQGEAAQAMHALHEKGLDEVLPSLTQPLLGICIGQQLLCQHSDEGDVDCLGIFPTTVHRFAPTRHEDKVPHMGWNQIRMVQGAQDSPLLRGIPEGAFVYFVHSFYVPACEFTIATTDYILPFSAAIQRDNFFATQFHPEKSGSVGEQILHNFLTVGSINSTFKKRHTPKPLESNL